MSINIYTKFVKIWCLSIISAMLFIAPITSLAKSVQVSGMRVNNVMEHQLFDLKHLHHMDISIHKASLGDIYLQAKSLLATPEAPTLSYKAANALFLKAKFKSAYLALLPYAKQGDAKAQLEIGFMFEFGRGVAQSYKTAALWYFNAIHYSQFGEKPLERGYGYYFGALGYKQNFKQAAHWLRMAAELGFDKY